MLAKVHDETSVKVKKLYSEQDSVAAPDHELMASIRCVVKACKERNDVTAVTLVKLRKICNEDSKVMVEAHVAEWGDLQEQVASLTKDFRKSLEFQTIPGLVTEAARLRKELCKMLKN